MATGQGDWSRHTLGAPFWALGFGVTSVIELEHKSGGTVDFAPGASTVRFEFPARGDKTPVILRGH